MSHDIVVIGSSAGGIPVLRQMVRDLPSDFAGSIFVVQHIPPWQTSHLGAILADAGPLPAIQTTAKLPIEKGRIYVAPPDHHLLIDDGHVTSWRGPKENRHRPAINPLFRSAAVTYQQRVMGIVLSGLLDDGTAGLWWVKRYGGLAVVQDPVTAEIPDMPRNALEHVEVDYVVDARRLAELVGRLGRPPASAAIEKAALQNPAEG